MVIVSLQSCCIVGKSSVFEQSKAGPVPDAPAVKINIPENEDILRCPVASDGENVSISNISELISNI